VRQLQKKQITIKFLCSVKDLLSTKENIALFVKERGFEILCAIPDEVIIKGGLLFYVRITLLRKHE
jgi:hypothetical protein